MFGIAYKPFIKKKEEYSMPKGAAFEDEAEFEKDNFFTLIKSFLSARFLF